ncbi:nicotinamide riboside transporter PnuC [Legionella bononiensis]|uniref:Nicotinamide riboside transporter PnuC n=1 Tax=Legionella bononiensis TaxID=2793102 RepID=A0ABS1W8H4_9GAMM|nr:nicotinamide riboside transporter PnuC [Legionella bononiensis]MBL7479822.1 nicotinamide mononucleotide transporter [Legionella bononiensis]MBL7525663.1 nicotinamide mononucleotide transporter [Legionella bononiensis]MBL7561846.1 nicotinamide mononucleotide transporter [Legionella bononiensis]
MLFDLFGALASLLSTYFFIRLNNKAWPMGILATVLNGWLYWHKGIYADMMLEIFYFLSMCYGWSLWYRQSLIKETAIQKPLKTLNLTQWLLLTLTLGTVFIFIYYILHSLTHSTVAIMDAATTSMSLVAQWLMCHKIIATWVLWFITDALFAVMYLNKSLPFHCGLMLIYTGLAITGYLVWARKSRLFSKNNNNYEERIVSV